MNLPKFPHSAMFVGVTACGKTEFLLRLLETIYNQILGGCQGRRTGVGVTTVSNS